MVMMNEEESGQFNRLTGQTRVRSLLNVDIPVIVVPVAPGRNLAVIVEAAVRNHILRNNGYDASEQLIERQQQAISDNS